MPGPSELLPSVTFRILCAARERLHEEWAQPLPVTELAAWAGFSRAHFIRLFAHAFGTTPHQYQLRLRLEHAKHVLRGGGGVTEACFDSGFASLGSFSARFSREFGQSPSAYRKEMRRLFQVPAALQGAFVPLCFLQHFTDFALSEKKPGAPGW